MARALIDLQGYPDAVNRAYYAVFHLTTALLLIVGQEPRSHAGAKALLGSELVQRGRISVRAAEIFAELERQRLAGDYRRFITVTREEAEQALASAVEFESLARAFLASQRFG